MVVATAGERGQGRRTKEGRFGAWDYDEWQSNSRARDEDFARRRALKVFSVLDIFYTICTPLSYPVKKVRRHRQDWSIPQRGWEVGETTQFQRMMQEATDIACTHVALHLFNANSNSPKRKRIEKVPSLRKLVAVTTHGNQFGHAQLWHTCSVSIQTMCICAMMSTDDQCSFLDFVACSAFILFSSVILHKENLAFRRGECIIIWNCRCCLSEANDKCVRKFARSLIIIKKSKSCSNRRYLVST
jgi:hypothetical protein